MSPISASMTIDWITGECFLVAKDGRRYSLAQLEAAERAASSGDAEAAALLAALDHTPEAATAAAPHKEMTPDDYRRITLQSVHDCPLCAEERARTGKDPEALMSWTAGIDPPLEDLLADLRRDARDAERRRDPHWWQGRRTRRGRRGRR